MSNHNQCANMMDEKVVLQDCLISQKHLTDSYNTFAGECTNTQLRDAFLNILKEEHCIQSDIFSNMQTKGWYQVEAAEQQKIDQAKQKLTSQQG